ncbi:MAG: lipopolysaccharide heptosyltransferase II [Ignavibacteriae bacterium]|nr:lipopolysaccharide heptosyltransferase II [Ignavibacteriota bacterium]
MPELLLNEIEKKSIKKILVIQTAFIGDAILSTPILRAIKDIYPNSILDILVIPQTSNLFRYNPHVNNIIEFDKKKFTSRIISFIKISYKLYIEKYDAAISVQSSLTSSILMLIGKIKIRIGYPRQKLLTHTIKLVKGLHLRKRVLRLLEPFGYKSLNDDTELFYSEKEEVKINSILNNSMSRFKIGIAPSSAQFTKQWPKEYFKELLKLMNDDDIEIYLIGGKEDKILCNEIVEINKMKIHNLAGELSLLDSAALIINLNLLLSNDSAPMHIANAVKTDVIAIFGPTVKEFGFYPYRGNDKILEIDLDCRPCGKHGGSKCPLGHFKCMLDLKPDYVYQEIKQKLFNNDKFRTN